MGYRCIPEMSHHGRGVSAGRSLILALHAFALSGHARGASVFRVLPQHILMCICVCRLGPYWRRPYGCLMRCASPEMNHHSCGVCSGCSLIGGCANLLGNISAYTCLYSFIWVWLL